MNNYINISEAAKKWNISVRRVQELCKSGAIIGVTKFGRAWMIPETAEKPIDGRTSEAKQIRIDESKLPHLPLPRKCPLLYMTDLYSVPGSAKECVRKLAHQPEAAALLDSWFAYARGDIDRALSHLSYFLKSHSGFNAVISGGMLLSMCAVWQGDANLWRIAKKHIYETPAKNEDEQQALLFWLAATDSSVFDIEDFPEWFKIGRFKHIHLHSAPVARLYYAKYLFISARNLAMGKLEIKYVTKLGLMRTIPYIVEPMIAHAVAEKMIILEISLRLLCACAYHNYGDDKNAIYHIDIAIEKALPDGFLGILAEYRRHLDTLLDDRLAMADENSLKQMKKLYRKFNFGWIKLYNELNQGSVLESFSPRELEVAKLAAFGLSNKEIAEQLHISVGTVKQVISMAMNKSGVANRTDLGAYI